jgi:hypothetical protein
MESLQHFDCSDVPKDLPYQVACSHRRLAQEIAGFVDDTAPGAAADDPPVPQASSEELEQAASALQYLHASRELAIVLAGNREARDHAAREALIPKT